ncbi:hypothetical protein [Cellvibrio mixtus]|uniref:hypothetical protein n=1 Tax=Cellvibrio mixtus TaxID=39650 RepID=UPI000587210D|nr:hypothetical protein [Cellvibrio mixtus]
MKTILDRCIESLALMTFLIYLQVGNMATRADWLLPYLLASGIGLGATVYILRRGILLNRLLLGVTLYFCSGLLGLLVEWDWLNDLYGTLGAVAMLGWIFLTGVFTGGLSPYGFLGVRSPGYFSIVQSSGLLLIACAIATVTAWYFMHNKLLGEWVPFIFLFSMRSLLLQLHRRLLRTSAAAG